jgi:hypothetical protein
MRRYNSAYQEDNPVWARGVPAWPSRIIISRPSRVCQEAAWRRIPARPDPPDLAQPGCIGERGPGAVGHAAQPGKEKWPARDWPAGPDGEELTGPAGGEYAGPAGGEGVGPAGERAQEAQPGDDLPARRD